MTAARDPRDRGAADGGDRRPRLRKIVEGLGFATTLDFLAAHPVTPLTVLAKADPGGFAASQVLDVAKGEADQTRRYNRLAHETLMRQLHENAPEGWLGHDAPGSGTAVALWVALISVDRRAERRQAADDVADHLRRHPPPGGWLPHDLRDDHLQAAFADADFDLP